MEIPLTSIENPLPEFLSGGGEMGELIRQHNWESTSLGPVETWPQSLRTCIRIMLTSRQPIWIGWGKELIKLYNDPYLAIVGGKHPWALGRPASVVWKDIWKDIEPMLRQVMEKDQGTYVESQLLIMERNGYPEETYYTFSYTPIPGDDGKTAGMFCANTDDTDRIISGRQLKTLTQLGKSLTDCQTNEEVMQRTIKSLEENPWDFPFAIFRTIHQNKAVLMQSTSLGDAKNLVKDEIDLERDHIIPNTINKALASGKVQLLEHVQESIGLLPLGAWPIPPDKILVLPILQTSNKEPYGVLIIGLNPYRLLDEKYLGFIQLVSDQIATSFADVHVLEEERKRAQALAEIDRAKTIFFSNISHEFRTPLTLLLGPIEDALHDPNTIDENRLRMDVAHRNALRMQKLVNTLLEFSRIEAGRMEGKFRKVKIGELTRDLASTFQSAIEKAGMQLIIEEQPVKDDVYVDPDMWEKIVLNLVSNAFKYSEKGAIRVETRQEGKDAVLQVIDQGIGIPGDQLDRIFDRFHRVDNLQGRSEEGTGIGLAMVKELVKMHDGQISVSSEPGKGSCFRISLPVGKDHLPEEKLLDETITIRRANADAYLQEALKWIPEEEENTLPASSSDHKKPTILLADDNADMRAYVKRLLQDHFHVITAKDGEDAWEKMQEQRPALVVSDIMMPRMDGFGLLKKLRSDERLHNIPVIFLSARAGEESKVEGLEAGADDYLVKPFSAKELLARVEGCIRLVKTRENAWKSMESLFRKAPVAISILRGNPLRYQFINDEALLLTGRKEEEVVGKTWDEVFPEFREQGFGTLFETIMQTRHRYVADESPLQISVNGKKELRFLNYVIDPIEDETGKVNGLMSIAIDVTYSVLARKKIEESENYFRKLADTVPAILWITEKDGSCSYLSKSWYEITGQTEEEALGFGWLNATHPEDRAATEKNFLEANREIKPFLSIYRMRMKDGSYRWSLDSGKPRFDKEGNLEGFIGTVVDIHEAKVAEDKIRESERSFRQLANALPQLVWETNEQNETVYFNEMIREYGSVTLNEKRNWNALDMVHPDDLPAVTEAWNRAAQNRTIFSRETRLLMKDGSYRWHLSRAIPLFNEEGRIIKWFGSASDIHSSKEQAAILEEEVKKRTAELNALNRILQDSNQELQQFAHVASHDLKEPLRKIKTFASRLAIEEDGKLADKSKQYLSKIHSASDRMATMIEGVLNYSMINAHEQPTEKVNLNDVFRNIESDLELLISQKQARIIYKDLPTIEGSGVLLYQLFYNLVNNSLKFSKAGTPSLIQVEATPVLMKGEEGVVISLRDNGIGFEPEFAERIFESFTRLNPKDHFEGTGLGLSLCRRIAERHGGSIEARSHLGEGAEFIVRLPMHQYKHQL